jgi:hypothetical protein
VILVPLCMAASCASLIWFLIRFAERRTPKARGRK